MDELREVKRKVEREDVHKGLDKAEIRDLISILLEEACDLGSGSTEWCVIRIKEIQEDLIRSQRRDAAKIIMEMMGWKDYDVSDYACGYLPSFIGTREEAKSRFPGEFL